jgi:hypothetical protein
VVSSGLARAMSSSSTESVPDSVMKIFTVYSISSIASELHLSCCSTARSWNLVMVLTQIYVNKIEFRASSEKTPIVGEIQKVQSLLAHRV